MLVQLDPIQGQASIVDIILDFVDITPATLKHTP